VNTTSAVAAYRFEGFVLDLMRGTLLTTTGEEVPIRRKAFQLLRLLVENAGRLLNREAINQAVWPDVTVSDDSITQCVREIRRALGDEAQRILKTVSRRGYLLAVDVATVRDQLAAVPALPPDRPSIAVLPFTNMSDGPEQEYFADGLVEDITTELSRYRDLFVIARNSSFQYKGHAVDVRQVGRELGVRYVLEGSVRRSGNRIRVSTQLISAETGGHLWAEKYDQDQAELFALQDTITERVVSAIQPEILIGEGRRAACKAPINLDAFECCMRGIWHFHHFTREDNRLAESWLRRSIELDPTLARAHVRLARLLAGRCWSGSSEDIDRELQESQALAERALILDHRDPESYFVLSVLALMGRRFEQALATAQQAIGLNQNCPLGYFMLGEIRIFIGQFAEALEPIAHCLRLSPTEPFAAVFLSLIGLAHYHLCHYDEAIHYCEQGLQRSRSYVVLRTMLAALGQTGRIGEARVILSEMDQMKPSNFERYWELTCPYAEPSHEAHFIEGLRKAGYQSQTAA
jgi:TolB-like protein